MPSFGMQVSEEAVAQGRRVMEQAAEQLREILREGNLLMLPVLPSAPPDRSAAPEELAAFERAALQLSSIAALAGLPQARLQNPHPTSLQYRLSRPANGCDLSGNKLAGLYQELHLQSHNPTDRRLWAQMMWVTAFALDWMDINLTGWQEND